MNRGLLMSTAEKEQRHAKLHEVVTTQTSHTWAAMLVKMLLGVMGTSNMARQTPVFPTDNMFESYAKAKKRLFLCDYDVRALQSMSVQASGMTALFFLSLC